MVSLYSHQKEAITKMRTGSILCGGVGTGKSRTSIAYYYIYEGCGTLEPKFTKMKKKIPLYIITTARKRDTKEWEWELAPFLISADGSEEGINDIPVVIDSWNNIRKYTDVSNAFFIFDEQRVVSFGAWSKAFINIARKNHWILLTATPGDTWMDYISVFIANGFYRNKTEFIREHVVYNHFSKYPKVDRYINTAKLERQRRMITVNMKYEKKTIPHKKNVLVGYDEEATKVISKMRWNPIDNAPIKNVSEYCQLLRRATNSYHERLGALKTLILEHPKSIIFYNFNYELDLIKKLLDDMDILYAEWNGHKHEPIPKSDKWAYLVQYTAGAEGWNCIETDTIIFYSQNYSYKIMIQSAGRIDRLNTPFTDLYYYYLISNSFIDKAISQALRKKQNFNESSLIF